MNRYILLLALMAIASGAVYAERPANITPGARTAALKASLASVETNKVDAAAVPAEETKKPEAEEDEEIDDDDSIDPEDMEEGENEKTAAQKPKPKAKDKDDDEEAEFTKERYDTILKRFPFGVPPAGFDPTNPTGAANANGEDAAEQLAEGEKTPEEIEKEQEDLRSQVRISGMVITPEGETMVAFSSQGKHYYMAVGETSKDSQKWFVKSADTVESKVTLVKNEIEVTLAVGEGGGGGAPKGGAAKSGSSALARLAQARRDLTRTSPPPPAGGVRGGGGTLQELRERRMQRDAAALAERQERERKDAEEKKLAEQREREEKAREEQAAADRAAMRNQMNAMADALRQMREEKKAAPQQEETSE